MWGTVLKWVGAGLLIAAALAAWSASEYQRALTRPLPIEEPVSYVIEPGANLRQIVGDLGRRGILGHPELLAFHARWTGRSGRIQAGEYQILPGDSALAMLERFVAGDVRQHALTLVEGWTFAEVMDAVNGDPHLVHTLGDASPEAVMERIGAPGVAPEGQFYPDTYHFPRGTTDVEFLERAHDTMQRKLATAWADRAEGLPYRKPYEALILASIVEKETAVASERAEIAGVFVRRLQKGMRLETDPTVIYGMGEDFDGNLRRRDLARDNPYNTYVHKGLPPTPIAMPGGESIGAALNPAPGDALFFVSKGDGSHHFSSNYREHRRAVARYQLGRDSDSGSHSRSGSAKAASDE